MSHASSTLTAASVLAITRIELLAAAPDVPVDVAPDADLVRDLGVDLATLRVFADRIEYRFGMAVPDGELTRLRSLDHVAERIVRRAADVHPLG